MDENLKKEIIMEHYQNPINRHRVEDSSYKMSNTKHASCIDDLDIYVKVENNKIVDIAFDGEACAISVSSTSIMINNLIGKTIDEAKEYIINFNNMINEKEYDSNLLGEACCYDTIYKQGNRKNCAFIPYEGLLKVLDKSGE